MNQSASFPQAIWNLSEEFLFWSASCRPSDSLSSGLLDAWRYKPLFFPQGRKRPESLHPAWHPHHAPLNLIISMEYQQQSRPL